MLLPDTQRLLHLLAHEMRSPLSASTGYVRLLADGRVGGPPTPAQQQILDQLRTALGRAATIIGQTATLTDPVPLGDHIAVFNLARMCFGALGSQGVTVELDLPDEEDARRHLVAGDHAVLATAFQSFAAGLARTYAPEPEHALVVVGHVEQGPHGRVGTLRAGRRAHIDQMGSGPDHPGCCEFDIWQGGLGVSLVRAALVIAGCGGRLWALDGASRATLALQLPLEDAQS